MKSAKKSGELFGVPAAPPAKAHAIQPVSPPRFPNRIIQGRYFFCYAMLTIPVALFTVFRIVPIMRTLQLSVRNWDLISPTKPFVGVDNFHMLFRDPSFHLALSNTTVLAFVTVSVTVSLGLLVAALLARRRRLDTIYQLLYFLPYIAPIVPAAVVWRWIYETRYGLLNHAISLFGIGPISWLTDPGMTLWAVTMVSIWKMLGYNILLLIVGLRAIPPEYGEAGQIDGASTGQLFRFITFPLLVPIMLLVSVISTINAYNVFTQAYVLASDIQGAPGSLVRVLIYDIFENAFRFYRMGYASAEAAVFLVLVLLLTLVQFRAFRSRSV